MADCNWRDPLIQATEALGEYWLGGGTLLGFVRGGSVIEHDTDLDLQVIDRDPDDVDLRDLGYTLLRTTELEDGRRFQTAYYDSAGQVIVDVLHFYSDIEPGHLVAYTDHGIIGPPQDLVLPLAVRTFGDLALSVPDKAEDYLTWHYGPGWRDPQSSKGPWQDDVNLRSY